jgi:hypothetical protein
MLVHGPAWTTPDGPTRVLAGEDRKPGGFVGEVRHLRGMREPIMGQRINYGKLAPEGIWSVGGLETCLRSAGLEPSLLD